jgi:hypothetical protein
MPLPPESHRLRPDHLPTPFSADQIRAGSHPGRRIRIRTEATGSAPAFREVRYLATDPLGATQRFTPTDADGIPIGPSEDRRSTWLDLQGHASFPADRATIEEASLELAWGTEPCWLYRVADGDTEMRYWFAQRLPGMPAVVETWAAGDLVERREIISTTDPPSD